MRVNYPNFDDDDHDGDDGDNGDSSLAALDDVTACTRWTTIYTRETGASVIVGTWKLLPWSILLSTPDGSHQAD